MKDKFCFKCKRLISDDENYFEFIEYDKKKVVRTFYAHKSCWNQIKEDLNIKNKAIGLMIRLESAMIDQGIFPEKKEEVMIV